MGNRHNYIFAQVIICCLLFIGGCTPQTIVVTQEQLDQQVKSEVTRFGNGIYYFPYSNPKTFASKLSQFLDIYDGEFEIVSITDDGAYHSANGYVVVLRAVQLEPEPLDKPAACDIIQK